MEQSDAHTKSTSPHLYTIIVSFMALGAVAMAAESIFNQPSLHILRPIGMLAVCWAVPAITVLRRLETGTLSGGLLLFILAAYASMGAASGVAVYANLKGF
jgi:hypothetical protein